MNHGTGDCAVFESQDWMNRITNLMAGKMICLFPTDVRICTSSGSGCGISVIAAPADTIQISFFSSGNALFFVKVIQAAEQKRNYLLHAAKVVPHPTTHQLTEINMEPTFPTHLCGIWHQKR